MRLLKFNIDAQQIQKDPECDFSNIVSGTKDYLKAQFTFSPEWQDCTIAQILSVMLSTFQVKLSQNSFNLIYNLGERCFIIDSKLRKNFSIDVNIGF